MKKLGFIKNCFYSVIVVLLLSIAVLVIAGKFGIGGVRALVVQSGSMEPTIRTKSIVVTAPSSSYNTNDIITFKQSGRDAVLVTHRVMNVLENENRTEFVTKGDANEEADGENVPSQDVVGKVLFSIPFVGAVISFAQTTPGFIALIVIPAVAIVYSELLNIKKQIITYISQRKRAQLIRPFEEI